MSSHQVRPEQRFSQSNPCPICRGHKDMPEGQAVRCWGFMSDDGEYAHCSREEQAGQLERNPSSSTFAHRLEGDCRCGILHGYTPAPSLPVSHDGLQSMTLSETYVYEDKDGGGIFRVQRRQNPRSRKKIFWQETPDGNGGWLKGLNGIAPVLWRLPELIKADPNVPVYLGEGEEVVKALLAKGLVTTCNPMGAGKWKDDYSVHLKGRDIVILPDNDDPGRRHAQQVADSVVKVARSVKIVELPDLPPKGDAVDFFKSGGTVDELRELVEATPDVSETIQEAWEAPTTFSESVGPEFPVGVFPGKVQRFADALTNSLQVPPGLVGTNILAITHAACAGRAIVRLNEDWQEQLCEYFISVLPSGEKKTAVLSATSAPLEQRERELVDLLGPEIAQVQVERDILEKRVQELKGRAAKANEPETTELKNEAVELAKQLSATGIPSLPRLLADDATPEAISKLMTEQDGRIAIFSAEGGILETADGRYSDGVANIDIFLKGHSGDSVRIDRKNGPPQFIPKPCLTLCLDVQPDVIETLASKNGFRGRGLLARIKFAILKSNVGYRSMETTPVSTSLKQNWQQAVAKLLTYPDPADGEEHAIRLSADARRKFQDYRMEIEESLRPGANLSEIADWGNKLAGSVARFAGVLHMLGHAYHGYDGYPWSVDISGEIMEKAITLGEYYRAHALVAFSMMGVDKKTEQARKILATIERHGFESFSVRDLYNLVRRTFSVAALSEPLKVLEDMGYIRIRQVEASRKAGRPRSPVYEVNPLGCTQNPHNPHNSSDQGNIADIADSAYTSRNDTWEEEL